MKPLFAATLTMMLLSTLAGCDDSSNQQPEDDTEQNAKRAARRAKKKAKAAAKAPDDKEPVAEANPYAMKPNGLPVTIPAPGSKVPTIAEWNAVPREINVSGSGSNNCETKMLREWLRVSCRKHVDHGDPGQVDTFSGGQQHFQFPAAGQPASGVVSVVVQVVKQKKFRAKFHWADTHEATLKVSWPGDAADPTITLL